MSNQLSKKIERNPRNWILGEYSKKTERNPRNLHKYQKHLAIDPTTIIIIVIGSVIFHNKLPTSTIMKID